MDKLKPPKGLRQSILIGILQEERRKAKNYFLVSAAILPVSLFGVIFFGKLLIQSFYQSGFREYLSLLLSGDWTILTYSKELAYSLSETIPILSVTAFLTTLGFFIWAGANALMDRRHFSLSAN